MHRLKPDRSGVLFKFQRDTFCRRDWLRYNLPVADSAAVHFHRLVAQPLWATTRNLVFFVPPRPWHGEAAGFWSKSIIAAASDSESAGGTRLPVTPSSTASSRAPTRVATTGFANEYASGITPLCVASMYGNATRLASLNSSSRWPVVINRL